MEYFCHHTDRLFPRGVVADVLFWQRRIHIHSGLSQRSLRRQSRLGGTSLLARHHGRRLVYGSCPGILLCVVYLFLIITNWWYFDFFQSLYNYESLKARQNDIFEGTRAMPAVGYRGEAVTISLLTAILATISVLTYRRPARSSQVPPRRGRWMPAHLHGLDATIGPGR